MRNKIISKLKNKFKYSFLPTLVKFSLFINLPVLTSIIFLIGTSNKFQRKKYKILCLGRSVFNDDVKALSDFSNYNSYSTIQLIFLDTLLKWFIKTDELKKITEGNYHNSDYGADGKLKLRKYLMHMLPSLKRFIKFDAILSGNFGYVQQQELSIICSEMNIPFLVLYKEGLGLPESYDEWKKSLANYKFFGKKIIVYTEGVKKVLLSANIPGINENSIVFSGIPRMDRYFKFDKKREIKNQIVFFSFAPEKFNWLIFDKELANKAYERTYNFHKWLIDFAFKHKDYKIIIKTKRAKHFLEYVNNILSNAHYSKCENLIITNSINPSELIVESEIVIGYYSTSMIEAITANKFVISPYFGDLIVDRPWDYFDGYNGLIKYVKSYEMLEDFLLNKKKSINYEEIRYKFLRNFISYSDGESSLRVENEIIELISKIKKNS